MADVAKIAKKLGDVEKKLHEGERLRREISRARAWGPPAGALTPRPTIRPSRTMTQPTLGLGRVRWWLAWIRASASAIHPWGGLSDMRP